MLVITNLYSSDQEQTLLEQAQQRHSEIDAQNARATVRLAESHERRAEATFKLAESQVKMAESLGKDAEGKMQIAQAITRLCAIVENYGAKFFQTSVSSPVKVYFSNISTYILCKFFKQFISSD